MSMQRRSDVVSDLLVMKKILGIVRRVAAGEDLCSGCFARTKRHRWPVRGNLTESWRSLNGWPFLRRHDL
jgi:hypothetical protein